MKLYLVRISGEVILKASKTRIRFEKRLVKNIIDMCRKHGIFNLKIVATSIAVFNASLFISCGGSLSVSTKQNSSSYP